MTTATGDTLFYYYDALKRPSTVYTKTSNGTTRFYTARNYKSNGLKSTILISGFAYRKSNGSIINYNTYEYDIAGNITKINKVVQNGSQTQTQTLAEYKYDNQNQLIKETRENTSYQYSYDTAGNIQNVSVEGVGDYITYTYGNNDWQDLLTKIKIGSTPINIAYEGQAYDVNANTVSDDPVISGNPINWYNGTLFTNLTWTQGRRLSGLTKKGAYSYQDQTISYTYDMEGIRSSKTVGNSVYRYTTQDGRVVREMHGGRVIDFIYDAAGQPFAMELSDAGNTPTTYYYVLNAQGDVVGLIDASGAYVATYTYDAWGMLLSSSGIMADTNPLRYRGYYYDSETGWYYLKSRYYDPSVKRFLNADCFTASCSSFLGHNMFAYCVNNPVSVTDSDGNRPSWEHDCGGRTGYTDTGKKQVYRNGPTTVTVRMTSITIDANMSFNGRLNANNLKQGIKTYWEETYTVNGTTRSVSVNIHSSIGNNCIKVDTYVGSGQTVTKSIWRGHSVTTVNVFTLSLSNSKYDIGWAMAHEFGHCLGLGDYYPYADSKIPGYSYEFHSIMNDPTKNTTTGIDPFHASDSDIEHVLISAMTGQWTDWEAIP